MLPDDQPTEWPIAQDECLVGRSAPANLIIPLPAISRQHARILYNETGYFIADLDSRNGTFLNGAPVSSEPQRIKDGDLIVLGGAIALRFQDASETVRNPRIGRLRGGWIDETTRTVYVNSRRVEPPLSPPQYALLNLLYRSAGQVFAREEIIAAVWPDVLPQGVSEEALDGLVKRLRARLRQAYPEQDYLEAVRGHGLRLVHPE